MKINETGGEEQVIDQTEVDSIAAALSGSSDDDSKKEEPEEKKIESNNDTEKKTEPKPKPEPAEKKVVEKEGGSEEESEKENLSNFLKKDKPVSIKQNKKVISEVTEGKDFEIAEDGKVRIYASHIRDDIDKIKSDAKVYVGLFNSKHGKQKAEVIAKSLGFTSDITRSAGAVAKDVISAYLDASRDGDAEKMEQIRNELFPEALTTENSDNYSFVGVEAEKDEPNSEVEDNDVIAGISKKEIIESAEKYVDSQLYRYVGAESSEDEVSATREKLKLQLMESTELFKELSKDKFNPETGEKLNTQESFFLAANKIFKETELSELASSKAGGGGKEAIKDKTEEDEVDRIANIISG